MSIFPHADSGHGQATSGKLAPAGSAPMGGLFGSIKQPSQDYVIKSFELENTFSQTVMVDDFYGLLSIEAQGDGMYMYCSTRTSDPYDPYVEATEIKLWIVRSDTPFNKNDIIGAYIKTVVVKDVAYHFFCNYKPA